MLLTLALSFVLMSHYFCGNGIQVPIVLLTFFPVLLRKQDYRARNNGRSTDNVRTDWGVDQSTFRLAGHVDRSQSIVLKMKSVVSIVISM